MALHEAAVVDGPGPSVEALARSGSSELPGRGLDGLPMVETHRLDGGRQRPVVPRSSPRSLRRDAVSRLLLALSTRWTVALRARVEALRELFRDHPSRPRSAEL